MASIDEYNRKPIRKRLKSVKSALAALDSILKMSFLSAHSYLKKQVEQEEARFSRSRPRSKDRPSMPEQVPPLREAPKPWDRPFMFDEPPPLREAPKPWDRPFVFDDDEESEENAPSVPVPLGRPARRPERRTLPLKEVKEVQSAEDKAQSPKLKTKKKTKTKSKRKSPVPYEDAVAARFHDESGPIFQKLWRTASHEQRERIRSLFSVDEQHANLSGLAYALEALDPQHRLRGGLDDAAREWARTDTNEYFFTWLESNKRGSSFMDTVEYFNEEQRNEYKLALGPTIKYSKSKEALEKDNIYTVSQSSDFYASNRGISDRGLVHHSSFLAGQAVKAAGHMVFKSPGKLATINLSSGHYMPKPEHMRNALLILKRAKVQLDQVTAHPDAGAGEGFNAEQWLEG